MIDTTIAPGDILTGTSDGSPLCGLHRVLEVIPKLGRVTLIPIPSPRKVEGKKQSNYYAKGFVSKSLPQLQFWLESKAITRAVVTLPSHWYLSDADLRKLAPPTGNPNIHKDDRDLSPLEIRRNFRMKLIEPLIPRPAESGVPRPPDLTCLDSLVREHAKRVGVSAGQVFDALHRFYAFGCIKNALLPNNTGRSGAPGVPRRAKNNIKLGRKNAAAKAGDVEHAGLILTDTDVQNIQDAFVAFMRPGTTVSQAFLSMSATYYSSGYSKKLGHFTPDLLPAHLRPTFVEFKHHGPIGRDTSGAARRLMGEGNWARNYRPLLGTVRKGIATIGQVGSLDASPIDVNLVSCGDPLQAIGVGRGLFVRDAWLGLYFGWHVGINGLGTEDAKLAILRAATDKASLLARHNLDLPVEDFPSMFFSKYLSDNGELRSRDGIESIVDDLTSRIEFIASGRADRNSPSESGHHSRHRGLDHHLTGTTKGRAAKRGEPLAITKALLTGFAYERLLLLWIHWTNTKQQLPLHMLPTEMLRDFAAQGKTPNRSRIEIFRWAKENGYVSGKPVDPIYLRAHLLPRFTASIHRNGLILHRPKTGNVVELLHGARFNHEYLAQSGIIRDAIARGQKHIEVSADPADLSHVILHDKQGMHVIPNIKDDVVLMIEGGIQDLCAINDAEKLAGVLDASRRDQDNVDQQAFRQETEADAKEKKKAARDALGKSKAPSTKKSSVRDAQALERRLQLEREILRAANGDAPLNCDPPPMPPPKLVAVPTPPSAASPSPPRPSQLIDIRKERLSRFNSERKF